MTYPDDKQGQDRQNTPNRQDQKDQKIPNRQNEPLPGGGRKDETKKDYK